MSTPPLPRSLAALASLAIVFHIGSVLTNVLAAPSGPWPGPEGREMMTPPQLANSVNRELLPRYLEPLKLTHNYHFPNNRPGRPGVWFEVRLWDEAGKGLRTLRFPDPAAVAAVRHRQSVLAMALADDQPVTPPAGEWVAAPGREAAAIPIWELDGDRVLRLRSVPAHLVPRDRPVYRPSGWSLVLAHSYVRHLCRVHGAAKGELVRHTQEAIPPAILFEKDIPPDAFGELISHFGEVTP